MPSSSRRVVQSPPTTQKQRINWAIKHRKIFLFPNNDVYKPQIPLVKSNADIGDIELAQIRYEKHYRDEKRRFKEEKARKEEEERKKKAERAVAELREKHPRLASRVVAVESSTAEKPSSQPIVNKRPRPDNDDKDNAAPLPKRSKTVSKPSDKPEYGDVYEVPCNECAKCDRPCHQQVPRQLSCWECHQAQTACHFVAPIQKAKTQVDPAFPPENKKNELANEQSSLQQVIPSQDTAILVKAIEVLDKNFKFLTERIGLMSEDVRTIADYFRKEDGVPILGPINSDCGGGRRNGKLQSAIGERRVKEENIGPKKEPPR